MGEKQLPKVGFIRVTRVIRIIVKRGENSVAVLGWLSGGLGLGKRCWYSGRLRKIENVKSQMNQKNPYTEQACPYRYLRTFQRAQHRSYVRAHKISHTKRDVVERCK